MEWSLGIVDTYTLINGLLFWLFISSFLMLLSVFFKRKLSKLIEIPIFVVLGYFVTVIILSWGIGEKNSAELSKIIEPYKENAIIKELLIEAKKDNKISIAESQRLAYEIKKIKDQQKDK